MHFRLANITFLYTVLFFTLKPLLLALLFYFLMLFSIYSHCSLWLFIRMPFFSHFVLMLQSTFTSAFKAAL